MPLSKTCSVEGMRKTVSALIREGRPASQAIAIGYDRLKKACHVETKKRLTPKEITAMKKNPYPLLIAALANPPKGFNRKDINFAAKKWREMFGPNAENNPPIVVDIPGVEDGSIGIIRGNPLAIEYAFRNIKGSVKPVDGHRHVEGDTGSQRIRPAKSVIIDIVKNGKIQTTVIARDKDSVDNQGYYIS